MMGCRWTQRTDPLHMCRRSHHMACRQAAIPCVAAVAVERASALFAGIADREKREVKSAVTALPR